MAEKKYPEWIRSERSFFKLEAEGDYSLAFTIEEHGMDSDQVLEYLNTVLANKREE